MNKKVKLNNILNKIYDDVLENGIIEVEIDELTQCLLRVKDSKLIPTKCVNGLPKRDQFLDFEFDWSKEEKNGLVVTQLFAKDDNRIQGLISTKVNQKLKVVEINLVEASSFNNPHNPKFISKEYIEVGGHLFAIAIKQSFEAGFDGFVFFTVKTSLIDHYQKNLGAIRIGNTQKMYIDEKGAKKLYERHFNK